MKGVLKRGDFVDDVEREERVTNEDVKVLFDH